MSEIDEIFAAKTKAKVADSLPPVPSDSTKKKKNPKHKRHADVPADDPQPNKESESQPKKRPLPETVIDPSSDVTQSKRRKAESAHIKPKSKPALTKDNDNEAKFKDSRGSASRKFFPDSCLICF